MSLSVENLSCRRGDLIVISGLSFDLADGQGLVLRGPNGSGKTTLLRCLCGLTPPVSGRVIAQEGNIAYSGHADGIKAQLTVAENLEFWSQVFRGPPIDAALAAFDLSALADRQAQHLSAGQKRRLGLSRMLVTGRKLWLMDEPTVSLDAASVATFARVIETHLAQGGSAVIATHVDLGLGTSVRQLDLGRYRAQPDALNDPFLQEDLA